MKSFIALTLLLTVVAFGCSHSTDPGAANKLKVTLTPIHDVSTNGPVVGFHCAVQPQIANVAIRVQDDRHTSPRTYLIAKAGEGIDVLDTISKFTAGNAYSYTVIASADGYVSSDNTTIVVSMDQGKKILVEFHSTPDSLVAAGETLSYNLDVSDGLGALDAFNITILNGLDNTVTTSQGSAGTYSYSTRVPSLPFGVYRIAAFASAPGYVTSDTEVFYVRVTKKRPHVDMSIEACCLANNSVALRWKRVPGDITPDTIYTYASPSGTLISKTAADGNSAVVTNLPPGLLSFYVVADTAISNVFQWATAVRYGQLRMYESADATPGHHAGLNLSSGTLLPIRTIDTNNIDVALATDHSSASGVSIASPSTLLDQGGQITNFTPLRPGTLDTTYRSQGLGADFYDQFVTVEVPAGAVGPENFALHTRRTNRWARIELLEQPDHTLVGGSPGQRFVDVLVSYQSLPGIYVAAKPHPAQVPTELRY